MISQEKKKIERRDFLKSATTLIGGSVFLSSLPWFSQFAKSQEAPFTGRKARLAVIGTGSRGRLLLEILLKVPYVEIIALCDDYAPSLKAAIDMIPGYRPEQFTDYTALLSRKDIDGVVIASPLHWHHRMTIDALSAGKYVFCEKAMAMTEDHCKEMTETSFSTGLGLMVGHQRMFDPQYLEGIGRIQNGDLGRITQIRAFWHRNNDWRRPVPDPTLERKINWRLYNEYSLGLMTELASHQVHVANWALGAVPERVTGMGSINYWKDGREVFDNVNLVYRYANGTHLVYDSMISNKHYGLEEQVLGDLGTLELESGRFYPETPPPAPGILQLIHSIEQGVFEAIPIGGASWVPETAENTKGESFVPTDRLDDGTTLQMEAFARMVIEKKPMPELLEKAYYASIAIIMGHKAMVSGMPVDFNPQYMLSGNQQDLK